MMPRRVLSSCLRLVLLTSLVCLVHPTLRAEPSSRQRAHHLEQLGVDRWHATGQRGRGLKVAVLDSGFAGYHDRLGRALPRSVTVRSFRSDGNLEARDSQHGILCGEVVHALAPDADLLFANWEPQHPDQFLDAVRWAIAQGARVITCSIIMPTWSDGEGGGPVHAELSRLLGDASRADGVLFFACAGNTADRHWSGKFLDAGAGWHDWGEGRTDNPVLPWHNGRVSVELCAPRQLDLELAVEDNTMGQEVRHSPVRAGAYPCAVVRFDPVFGHDYRARVRATGSRTGPFHVFVLGGGLGSWRAGGSIPFPGDGPEVVTVGAVNVDRCRTAYSSCGPNSPRPKPDLVATVPFPSLFRARPFAGTSAAAPQAAGLAALVWAHHPDWTAERVRRLLCMSALDLGPPGHDWETGHGLIRLPRP
jgi:subtilisin family serine protease